MPSGTDIFKAESKYMHLLSSDDNGAVDCCSLATAGVSA